MTQTGKAALAVDGAAEAVIATTATTDFDRDGATEDEVATGT